MFSRHDSGRAETALKSSAEAGCPMSPVVGDMGNRAQRDRSNLDPLLSLREASVMTHGLIRYQHSGHLHFITFSCFQRMPLLGSAAARSTFENALEATRVRYGFCVIGYVVMPEHVHLLLTEPRRGSLSTAVQAIKIFVANRQDERPFWLPRYYDFNVFTGRKRIEKLRYIHRNPVRRGLVDRPEDWAWSSYRHYATGEAGAVEIESEWTDYARRVRGG